MDYERRALHAEHGVNATPSTFKRAVRHALKMVRMRKVVRVSRHLRQETFLRLWSCGYCVCVGLGLLCVCVGLGFVCVCQWLGFCAFM